jgi:lipoyl(octanoyl) transferase
VSFCQIVDVGLIGYADALALQKRLVAARKVLATKNNDIGDVLLLCEHPHVITVGRNGKREHLLVSEHVLRQKGVELHFIDRGGDVTYHGPGQIVGYPILNLGAIRRDVGWYVRSLEEMMIRATADFGIIARREAGKTGVWVEGHAPGGQATKKLGAIGVHLSRWITSHGFAYNVSTDLRYFDLIIPCGIAGCQATSLEGLLAGPVDPREAATKLSKRFGEVFSLEMQRASPEEVLEKLSSCESPEFEFVPLENA